MHVFRIYYKQISPKADSLGVNVSAANLAALKKDLERAKILDGVGGKEAYVPMDNVAGIVQVD